MPAIHEIFASVQGEGSLSGRSAIFIRFSGCSLRCSYCDTSAAWLKKNEVPLTKILAEVDRLRRENPSAMVVLTGGEPLEQNLFELVAELSERKLFTAIETNGLHFQDIDLDWWAVSPKDVSFYFLHPDLRSRVNELKILVTPGLGLDTIRELAGLVRPGVPIFLQPCGPEINSRKQAFDFFTKCAALNLPELRLGLQLHRVYDIP